MSKDNNRDNAGKFIKGNNAGKGRPIGSRVDELRRALIQAVTVEDIADITGALILQAKEGDLGAIKILFDRVLGSPIAIDVLERQGLNSIKKMERKLDNEDNSKLFEFENPLNY